MKADPRFAKLLLAGLTVLVVSILSSAPESAGRQEFELAVLDEASRADDGKGESGKRIKPRIEGLAVEVDDGDHLLVSFDLTHAFDENLEQRIESGIATDLDYRFELVRPRWYWFNKTVERSLLQVVAMYNATSREYLVNVKHDGQLIASRVVRDREALQSAMTEISEIAPFTLTSLRGDFRLRFFIPTVRATDWAEARLEIDSDGEVTIRQTD